MGFANMKNHGHIQSIFWVVTATSVLAAAVTMFFTPSYNGKTLEKVEELARSGQEVAAVKALYSGRLGEKGSPSDDCGKAQYSMSDATVAVWEVVRLESHPLSRGPGAQIVA